MYVQGSSDPAFINRANGVGDTCGKLHTKAPALACQPSQSINTTTSCPRPTSSCQESAALEPNDHTQQFESRMQSHLLAQYRNDLTLADFNLVGGWSIHQAAKFNSLPNFRAIIMVLTLICHLSLLYSTSATGGRGLTVCSTWKWVEPWMMLSMALFPGWLYSKRLAGFTSGWLWRRRDSEYSTDTAASSYMYM